MRQVTAAVLAMAVLAGACGGAADDGAGGVEEFADQGRDHLAAGDPIPTYNSDPPTSGPHAPVWTRCGIYSEPIPDVVQVHNLEHGVVMVQYRPDLSDSDVESLAALVRGLGDGYMVVAPRPGLAEPVVASAWTRLQRFDDVDIEGLRDFWLDNAQRGPEVVPCPFEEDSAA